jgi:predicted CoA-binding protein
MGWPPVTRMSRPCGSIRTVYSKGAIRQTRRIRPARQATQVFSNPSAHAITDLLRSARIIAVVGISADPSRPSNRVARSLQQFGYRIIPVNPAGGTLLGEPVIASLDRVHEVLRPGERVDIVDVFRRPEHVAAIVDECIRLGVAAIWLQDGVIDDEAAQRAANAGIFTVMDRCLYRDRVALG